MEGRRDVPEFTLKSIEGLLVDGDNLIALQFEAVEEVQVCEDICRHCRDHIMRQDQRVQIL